MNMFKWIVIPAFAVAACKDPPSPPEQASESTRTGHVPTPTAVEPREAASAERRGKASPNADSTKFPFGYYDVSGRGAALDFCQVLRDRPGIECDTGERVIRWDGILDLGYAGTGQMSDANGDGRGDFCRCVGDAPSVRFSCLLASSDGFAKEQFGFDPPGRRDCDALNTPKDPPPAPTPVPATRDPQTAQPTSQPPSSCTPGNTSSCSCGAARGQMLCDARGRFGPC